MKHNIAKRYLKQYFIVFALIIIALLVGIPLITVHMLTGAYDEQIRIDTRHTSVSIQQTVRSFMDGVYNLCYELAENPSIFSMDGEAQQPILTGAASRNEYLELLFVTGLDGMQTARSEGVLANRGERWWFQQMMERTQPFISHSYYSLYTSMPCTTIFMPIYNGSEKVGIFAADINLRYIQGLAERFADFDSGRYSFIIDGEGNVIAHPDSSYVDTLTNYISLLRAIPQTDAAGSAIPGYDGNISITQEDYSVPERYRAVMSAIAHGESGLKIVSEESRIFYISYEPIDLPGYSDPWYVITLQDRAVSMGVIYQLISRVLLIITLIMIALLFLFFLFYTNLRNTMNSLENANNAKSAFLSTMSHEIRTPMNAILGITEIQIYNKNLEPEVRGALEKVYSSGELLLGIINNILDLSKIEAGKLELLVDKYEIASLISDTAHLNMMRIGSKQIEFDLQIDEKMPSHLLGDELRIKQILNNLLSNAFKYTASGTVTLTVSAEANEPDDGGVILVINVSDTGQGMTEEQVSKIFDEYSRFNDAINRSVEGTGLGMSITQNLICLMGGSIAIESKPGKGSTFIVRLPQKKADTEVLGREMAENLRRFRMDNRALLRRAQISREPMPYGNILIVDDVETNVYVAKGLLIPYGLKIDSADSGYTAIDIIKSGKIYDIIFMDHMMPEMDGIEAVKQIRALGYEHPIVALTANAVAGQADVFMNNGFDGFISKPIDLRQMNMLLNKLIRDKQPPEVIEAARQGAVAEMEQALKAKPQQQAVQSKKTVLNAEVAGLDIPKGLEQVNGDEAAYIKILRSYTDNIRSMLRSIETVSENSLSSYKITVHGIKGTSYYIFARQVGSLAEALEKASAAGDFSYVSEHNPAFLETAQKLLSDLEGVISAFDAENPRPKKDRPDDKLLLKLLDACQRFDMDDLDSAMEEIERYQYESDGGLAVWLRETANMMDMARIVEKLTDMGVGS